MATLTTLFCRHPDPASLAELVAPLRRGEWVVIDEIQRIPALLDEVHRLYEQHRGIHFALSGSSARKLRRAGANLPGHRAAILATYVESHLKEEITAEALVRQVDSVWKGFAFEALLHHELHGYASLAGKDRPLFHYSVSGSFDVDFLVQTRPKKLSAPRQFVAIEAKLGGKYRPQWAGGLRTLLRECGSQIRRGIIVYTGKDRLKIDEIDVMPAPFFLDELHAGRIVG